MRSGITPVAIKETTSANSVESPSINSIQFFRRRRYGFQTRRWGTSLSTSDLTEKVLTICRGNQRKSKMSLVFWQISDACDFFNKIDPKRKCTGAPYLSLIEFEKSAFELGGKAAFVVLPRRRSSACCSARSSFLSLGT